MFGVDGALSFDSESENSRYEFTSDGIRLYDANWDVKLKLNQSGQVHSESEVVVDLIFHERLRRVRCKSGAPVVAVFKQEEISDNEFSGFFSVELPTCEDAETGESLDWPASPLVLRGSFDRLQGEVSAN
jgi:hypothetical protein